MQFIIKAYDGEGMLEKRMEVRPRHLEGILCDKYKCTKVWDGVSGSFH